MLKANFERLVETCVAGEIGHPHLPNGPGFYTTGADGAPHIPLVQGGITLNVRVGDRAFDWAWGERVLPGVVLNGAKNASGQALVGLACIGNEATVISGALEGKESRVRGQKGVVVGKNSVTGLVTLQFNRRTTERLCVGDRVQIKACGQGLELGNYPDITVRNCSPQLFKAINPTEKGGRVRISVTSILPGKLMATGGGEERYHACLCEIQSSSQEIVKEYKLENLRLGDLVAVADFDQTFGARWHAGAITIGVVVHGASKLSGRGPGLTCLFTSSAGRIEPIITRKANLNELLKLA
jgi:hypothetical protein